MAFRSSCLIFGNYAARKASNLVAGTRAASAKLRPMIAWQITETGEQRSRELVVDAASLAALSVLLLLLHLLTLPRLRTIVSQAFSKIVQLDSNEDIAPISGMKRLSLTERMS